MPEVESESFTIIYINSVLVYKNKYYLQLYLVNCAYEIFDEQMIGYLDNNLFDSGKISFLILILYCNKIDLSERIDPAKSSSSKNVYFTIVGLSFKIPFTMVVMIWGCFNLVSAILLLSL